MYSFKFLIFSAVVAFSLSACERAPQKHSYTEIVVQPAFSNTSPDMKSPHPFMDKMQMTGQPSEELMASVSQVALTWKKPEGWVEEKGSGMRIVTFRPVQATENWECSIVSLGGAAGGLEANVARWMGQIKMAPVSSQELLGFIGKQRVIQTSDKISASVIDFTGLQGQEPPQTQSMMATILEYDDKTIFVKFAGSKESVAKNKENFINLLESLSVVK